MLADPFEIARLIHSEDPHPVVAWRLANDFLQRPECATGGAGSLAGLRTSRHYQALVEEQRPDGGWGRLHSMDTTASQVIPTTEFAVARSIALGLDRHDPVVTGAVGHLVAILRGDLAFADPPECNDRWATGTRLFSAATLALIEPDHPEVDTSLEQWAEIVERSFSSGDYDPTAEALAHRELHGIVTELHYLHLHNRYTVALLGSRGADLPPAVRSAYQRWLWNRSGGLGYLEVPMSTLPPPAKAGPLDRWFSSLEVLSLFPDWTAHGGRAIDWLWGAQGEDGCWDFGPRGSVSHYLPLSEDWRLAQRRRHDWTVRVLSLLAGV